MIKIVIAGDPIPARRPRVKGRHAYNTTENRAYRQEVQTCAMLAMRGKKPLTGEICAAVKLYRKCKRASKAFGDVDNHLKAIFDGLNQIAFNDDSQIVRCVVEKFTDKDNPRAEIFLETAGPAA